MKPDKVSIIIPALNEEEAVGGMVEHLLQSFPGIELIVINDGSTDNTAEVAEKAGARVISHYSQSGYGAGLRTGVEASSREFVLFCDADGQHRVEDVARVMEACDNSDMVIGARGQDSHAPLIRRPGKFILRRFANFLAGQKIPDLNSGLRILNKGILLKYIHLMPRGFSFSTTSTFAFLKSHQRVKFVPIVVKKRVGTSTVNQFKHGPQTLMLMLRLTVLFEPLKVFNYVSGFLFGMSFLSWGINGILAQAWGLADTTVLLFIAGLTVFMSGLLCDQVSALRREIHE